MYTKSMNFLIAFLIWLLCCYSSKIETDSVSRFEILMIISFTVDIGCGLKPDFSVVVRNKIDFERFFFSQK
jgi:hypothetical protein